MPFIGQQPITGAYHKLDSITTSATATYNLQLNGGAYYPTSANHLLVSLNGVMQAPQDSFTVSGSQITFASALTSSDSIDFIMALGDVLDIGVPSDGAVNTSQLANSAVTSAKLGTGAAQANISAGTITASQLTSTLDLSSKTLTLPAGVGGKVLQIESGLSTSYVNITGGTYSNVFSVTITPQLSNSKILVMAVAGSIYQGTGGATVYASLRLAKDGNGNFGSQNSHYHSEVGRAYSVGQHISYPFSLVDANVGTTNPVVYSVQARIDSGSGGLGFNDTAGTSHIFAMEIAA